MSARISSSQGTMLKKLSAILIVSAMTQGSAFGAVNSVASLANPLDNNGGGARALAMGSAFVGVADDSSAVLWNPAGLAGLDKIEVALHHNSWLAGIVQETVVADLPFGRLGTLGASVNYVNAGAIPGYDEAGTKTEDYSSNRYGMGLGWGMQFLPHLSGGITLKGAMQTVADSNYSGLAVDLGALWTPGRALRVGFTYNNLGTAIAGYSPASALRLGASYQLGEYRSNRLLLAGAGAWEPNGVSRLQVGVEDSILSVLALRLGYQGNLADSQIYGLTGLTAGLGMEAQGFKLDYAFLPFGDLGSAHRISLGYKFG